ncbi:MAG: molybdopterin-synthase adenylyltransferase MoeB [Firmicutes bacterium]|nr:molybdopterin-synthase adenylyltransferase MoeB [Bacillota bacterium]
MGDRTAVAGPLLTREQMERYSRHILLREVGVEGQRRLLDSRVLVIGAGGLGSPAALYLAAAGVGTLGIVDADVVDLSNLQRQILHNTADVGRPKTESARERLLALNPDVRVIPYQTVLTAANALEIIRDYDVVVNGCDNFATRYLVNDACVLLGKPLVDASILGWEAQAAVYVPGKGCYRCLYPAPPPPGTVPSCSEAGIIGAMAGILGAVQALEAVKLILGVGESLESRLLIFDALSHEWRELRRRRNPNCPVCGDHPTITQLIDYEAFCGVPYHGTRQRELQLDAEPGEADACRAEPAPQGSCSGAAAPAGEEVEFPSQEVWPRDAARYLGDPRVQWVDVREPWEYERYHIPGIRLLPMSELSQRYREIDPSRPAIVVCEHGQRSEMVVRALRRAGYQRAYSLAGGMAAWLNEQLPTER